MKKRKPLIFIFFLLLNFLPQFFVIISKSDNLLNWYITDDAFYYFKTAQNIIEGNGISFDGIDPTNGFHPFWMILCVPIFALARVDLFLPLRIVAALQILLNAASGFFLFEMVSEKMSKSFAWITALFWMFFPPIHGITTKLGLETGLNAFMLIVFFYLVSRLTWDEGERKFDKQLFWVGLCGVGVLFSRLDNIFVLLLVGIWLVFRGKTIGRISQIDFLLILLSAISSFFLRLSSYENIFDYLPFLFLLIGSSLVIKPTTLYFLNGYAIDEKKNVFFILKNTLLSVTISSILIFTILFISHEFLQLIEGFPRSAILIDWFISLVLIGGHHTFYQKKILRNSTSYEDVSLKTNWRVWWGRTVSYFSSIVGLLIAYLVFNYRYAGIAMPVSGQIKRWWGTLPNSVYGQPERTITGVFSGLLDPSRNNGPYWLLATPVSKIIDFLKKFFGISQAGNPIVDIFLLVLICGIFMFSFKFLLNKEREKFRKSVDSLALLPLFVGTVFHAMIYKSTGYLHAKEWYWIGEMFLLVLLFSILFTVFLEMIEKKLLNKKIISFLTLIICGFLWGKFSISILQQFPLDGNVPFEYNLDGEVQFIRTQTESGDVIGMTGGGLTAYFVPDRTILNLDGLINSADYFSKLKDGKITEYLIENNVKYIYGEELVLLDSDPYRWVFTDTLTVEASGPYFLLYKYDPIDN
ncbi:MAG: hypothetical protein Q7J07_01660 [Pelolinea sp.]|nr:hypothetical protein [Pelolinea sp.]